MTGISSNNDISLLLQQNAATNLQIHVFPINIRSAISSILCWLFAFMCILLREPYFFWNTPPYAYRVLGLAILIFWCFNLLNENLKRENLAIASLAFIVWCFLQFNSKGFELWFTSYFIFVVLFLLLDNTKKMLCFKRFVDVYTVSLLPGLVITFLILMGFDLPWVPIESHNVFKQALGVYYRQYPGMVVLSSEIFPFYSTEIFRFSGIFDEPGVIGSVSALLLAATNFDVKTWKGKSLLISGFISFSLSFYFLCIIYLFCKRPRIFVIILLLLITLPLWGDKFADNQLVSKFLVGRLTRAMDDLSSVDNRESKTFKQNFKNYWLSDDILLGKGREEAFRVISGSASYKVKIFQHGILGCFCLCIFYAGMLFFAVKNSAGFFKALPFVLVCVACTMQRPNIENPWFILIYLCGIMHQVKKSEI